MLLLVTIVLVLIAAVTLLIGIFGGNLALIFVSIGSSALAAIVLAVLSQVSRRKTRDATATAVAPTPLAPEPAVVAAAPAASPATTVPDEASNVAAVAVADAPIAVHLPIANYDGLRVNEILPKLEGLDLDQLEEVAQHEESTKNRATVLNRIDELMDELEAAEAGAPVASVDDLTEDIEIGEVVPDEAVSGGFPIPDYESLSDDEVIALLGDLDADELEEVAEYEETHANRDRVLDAIDDRLDELEGIAPTAAAAPAAVKNVASRTPKKAAATRAPAKKTPAKKAVATKAPTTKSVAKKAASTRTAAASSQKAVSKRAAAPAAKRAASSAKKAAPAVKKAAVKKAAVVKKATAAKKTAKKSR